VLLLLRASSAAIVAASCAGACTLLAMALHKHLNNIKSHPKGTTERTESSSSCADDNVEHTSMKEPQRVELETHVNDASIAPEDLRVQQLHTALQTNVHDATIAPQDI